MMRRIGWLTCLLLCCIGSGALAETNQAIPPPELDRALNEVLSQREYRWRIPHEKKEEPSGLIADLWNGLVRFTKRWIRPIIDLFWRIKQWIFDHLPFSRNRGVDRELKPGGQNPLMIVLLLLIAATLIFAYWRWRKRRDADSGVLEAKAMSAIPDIREENITADQLPEEEWYGMSRDLLSKGEYRLAIRALFMATLSFLNRVQLVRVARFKSNRDYVLELRRKAFERDQLLKNFQENVSILESVWYGKFPSDEALVKRFAGRYEEMKSQAVQE